MSFDDPNVLGGAASGAMTGARMGGPAGGVGIAAGALIGGVVGGAGGAATSQKARSAANQQRYQPKPKADVQMGIPDIEGYTYDVETGKYMPTQQTESKVGAMQGLPGGQFDDLVKRALVGSSGEGGLKNVLGGGAAGGTPVPPVPVP